jgi:DNA-binding helix-hairpin-helix protein with protein kinase domain
MTDLYALSVLIYQLLLCRHPLEGKNRFGDEVTDKDLGADAVFIEDPTNRSTRYDVKWLQDAYKRQGEQKAQDIPYLFPWRDLDRLPYTSLGPYLSEVVEKAFVKGLHDPTRRPSASDWEKALDRTMDLLLRCENPKCLAKWFVFTTDDQPVCPFCGTRVRHSIPVLNCMRKDRTGSWQYDELSISCLKGSVRKICKQIVLFDHAKLYPSHAYENFPPREIRTSKQLAPLALILRNGDKWGIQNLAAVNMILSKNGNNVVVKVGEAKCLSDGLRIQLDGPGSRVLEVQMIQ